MVHRIEPREDVARTFPVLGKLLLGITSFFCRFFPPVHLSHVVGVRSEATGDEIEDWLVACPLTPETMRSFRLPLPTESIQAGRLAEQLRARVRLRFTIHTEQGR
jgi:hypothetical protein